MLRLRYTFLLTLLLASVLPRSVDAQTATWWYPLGNLGATRQAGDTSKNQDTADLKIRWRTTALHNSATLLVGAIRSEAEEGETTQQVVGLFGDTLVILSSRGMVIDTAHRFLPEFSLTPNARFTLTGLFSTSADGPTPIGKPNVIGIGVDRNQRLSTQGTLRLYGKLINGDGSSFKNLAIDNRNSEDTIPNQSAGIYPVAAYRSKGKPMALAAISQNEFVVTPKDTMSNGLRRYDITTLTDTAARQWIYRIAPRTYPQAPAILHLSGDSTIVALSTVPYSSDSVIVNPSTADQTSSGKQYSVSVLVDSAATPVRLEIRPLPDELRQGEVHSYFVKLAQTTPITSPNGNYRLLTENHSPDRPGPARIVLVPATVATQTTAFLGVFEQPTLQDIGWSIVTADLDGRATSGPVYKNNPGKEIIASLRSLDGSDVADDTLYVIRYIQNDFGTFVPRQHFSGRLLCAGDVVSDTNGREEIIIADGNRLDILQLKDYRDPNFDFGDVKRPFRTVASFTLDSRILYAAIADLDGDGNNEIVVGTTTGTYAIGKPLPQPFGAITPMTTEACSPDTVELRWNRMIGGEGTITLKLHNDATGKDTVLADTYPAQGNSFEVATTVLTEGSYRMIVQDNDLPHLVDTSTSFMIHTPSIAPFDIADKPFGAPYHVGDIVSFKTTLSCIDTFRVERYDGSEWDTVPASISSSGATRLVTYTLGCPPLWQCGDSSAVKVLLRLVSDRSGVAPQADSLWLAVPSDSVWLTGDTTHPRSRRLQWNPSDFGCDSVVISYSADNGRNWSGLYTVASAAGGDSVTVPMDAVGRLKIRVCCGDAGGTACDYGITELTVGELPNENFVAPNPFNPNRPASSFGEGAAIVYRLRESGTVRITIFDASRTVTRVLVDGEERNAERTYVQLWDGRNGQGDIVANGPYICVIESSSSERIVLPIIVMQR